MKILCYANLKGGTGKSMLCYNMAGVIAEGMRDKKKKQPKRICVIDVDPQGNTTNNFGVDRLKPGLRTIVDVFENNIPADEVIIKTNTPGVSIIPGNLNLTATEVRIVNRAGREHILKYWLLDNKDYLEQHFDYIMFDTPPSFNILCQNVYIVCDSIVLVNDVSMNSIEGSEQFCALWRAIRLELRLGDNVAAFLINNLDKRIGMSKDYGEYLKRHQEFGGMVLKSIIPNDVRMKETELESKTINYHDHKCRGYVACKSLEEELYVRGIL